jgi:hypothetical protein
MEEIRFDDEKDVVFYAADTVEALESVNGNVFVFSRAQINRCWFFWAVPPRTTDKLEVKPSVAKGTKRAREEDEEEESGFGFFFQSNILCCFADGKDEKKKPAAVPAPSLPLPSPTVEMQVDDMPVQQVPQSSIQPPPARKRAKPTPRPLPPPRSSSRDHSKAKAHIAMYVTGECMDWEPILGTSTPFVSFPLRATKLTSSSSSSSFRPIVRAKRQLSQRLQQQQQNVSPPSSPLPLLPPPPPLAVSVAAATAVGPQPMDIDSSNKEEKKKKKKKVSSKKNKDMEDYVPLKRNARSPGARIVSKAIDIREAVSPEVQHTFDYEGCSIAVYGNKAQGPLFVAVDVLKALRGTNRQRKNLSNVIAKFESPADKIKCTLRRTNKNGVSRVQDGTNCVTTAGLEKMCAAIMLANGENGVHPLVAFAKQQTSALF